MKKNNITGGLILIVLALFLIGSSMGIIPTVPWFQILCTGLLAVLIIRSLWKRRFLGAVMSLCLVAWLWEKELGIEEITPWPLLLAGLLLGIGLNMIFRREKQVHVHYSGHIHERGGVHTERTENYQDGRHVTFENSFSSVSKYVNSDAFSSAEFENNFGSANIYFNNAIVANGEATVDVANNFGETNIYFPKTWRLHLSQESAFGAVKVYGAPNNDMDAPLITMKAEANFGCINIYFE